MKEKLSDIETCGLFIEPENYVLGVFPDGLLGAEKIVEIKCSYAAYRLQLTPEEKTFWRQNKSGEIIINKKHDWYYQIQGQLHIARKNECMYYRCVDWSHRK